jgi:predicted RNA-binding Zn-ribbon protein involved in translation (DUF1610 family)
MGEKMEQTECYKCGTEITAFEGAVHPLCSDCETSFDAWFAEALAGRA